MQRSLLVKKVVSVSKRSTCQSKKLSACELIKILDKCVANNYSPTPVVINRGRGTYALTIWVIKSRRKTVNILPEVLPALTAAAGIIGGKKRTELKVLEKLEPHLYRFQALKQAHGVRLYDVEGKEYLDFLSGYAAVSLGHCHPKIAKVMSDQCKQLTHTSRAVCTQALAEYGEYITDLFCYDKVLPMNSGTEAAETAVKLARKWGYRCKRISPNQAKIIFAENNFWGRSIAAVSASTDPQSFGNYGPFVPGFDIVPFSNIECLEYKIRDPNICAFMIEPVQGEAGVVIPDPCYLKQVRELCTKNKVLMIADEVQCGLGRTGSLLCCDIYRVRPDILVLGKALSAGFMPVSAVLADGDIMDVIEPGSHGSTFGGNALGCKIAIEALKTLQEENLIENSRKMGEILRACLSGLPRDIVCEVRGLGLLNAMVLNKGINASDVCLDMVRHGLLVKTAKENIIRLCPPLVINEKEVMKAASIIRHCLENSRGSCGSKSMTPKPTNQKTRNKFARYAEIMKKTK